MMNFSKGFIQVAILVAFSYIMDKLSNLLHIGIPGSIIGIIILFILLKTNMVKLKWIEIGGNWLLAEFLLFFIPSAVGVIQYKSMLVDNGIKILMIIILSSALVMTCSGFIAEKIMHRKEEKHI
ncbi:holin [Heyndrickxia shackletonii]|uniref:Holin n=1 Tax=Heyndrickxia shackletonii TaxID=157838 RepID=A0A0Q3WVH6_9BACI|nr:CidA/LrgA family holin-like protein [Heyndrickxia shackletonii]KQL52371.1 holin [Heyndrickxia shackletonii]NEY99070.1 CidA/LrgA family holin-like protein [Heyndrickxia shackletonii]